LELSGTHPRSAPHEKGRSGEGGEYEGAHQHGIHNQIDVVFSLLLGKLYPTGEPPVAHQLQDCHHQQVAARLP
jgi:hypothetical protein